MTSRSNGVDEGGAAAAAAVITLDKLDEGDVCHQRDRVEDGRGGGCCLGRRHRHHPGHSLMAPFSLRGQLLALLLGLFCWQSYVSVHKYLLGRVTSTFAHQHEERVAWPAVTICPVNAEPTSRIRQAK